MFNKFSEACIRAITKLVVVLDKHRGGAIALIGLILAWGVAVSMPLLAQHA